MKYKCGLVSMHSLSVGVNGFVSPLCDDCDTQDCDNPIEKRMVSIMGVTKKIKVFSKGTEDLFVVDCLGFSKK